MSTMTLIRPSLGAYAAFEAAAGCLSFSRAADQLHVTHGAISHQIRGLEEALGVKLFQRVGRGVVLTESGQRLFGHVREAFGRLRRGIEAVHRSPRRQRLLVSLPPALAARWVIPRLQKFRSLHPEIDTVLHASLELADFAAEEIDVAIRYGLGRWAGLEAHMLLREMTFPVCSPEFRGGKLPRTIDEVAQSTLLHDPRQPWDEWFRANGAESPLVFEGPVFSESNLVLEAAVNGQGVALADQALVERELASGALVKILAGRHTRAAYYIVHRRGQRESKVVDFRTWLLEEARVNRRRIGYPLKLK